jgi:FlaA1/EpsC-like NDP-sugar epimerase
MISTDKAVNPISTMGKAGRGACITTSGQSHDAHECNPAGKRLGLAGQRRADLLKSNLAGWSHSRSDRAIGEKAIPVTFTGLRTGDKMSEQFLSEEEVAEPSIDARLFRVTSKKIPNARFDLDMDDLSNSVDQRELTTMIETTCKIVPTYRLTKLLDRAAARSSA